MEKTDNEIIAEFMGLKLDRATSGGNRLWNMHGLPDFCKQIGISENRLRVFYASDLEFDKSWDWLMPVVDRIENTADGFISRVTGCRIEGYLCDFVDQENSEISLQFSQTSKLEAVYKAVVEFIKWYEESKNK